MAQPEADHPVRGRAGLLLLAPAAVFLLIELPFLGDPYGHDIESKVEARYTAMIVRNWERAGFLESRGRPILRLYPTQPPRELPYVNHPPGVFWLYFGATRLTGTSEAGLRVVATLTTTLAILLFTALVRLLAGSATGLVAGLLLALGAMTLRFGRMASYESPVLLAFVVLLLGRELAGRGSRSGWLLVFLSVVFASWIDWIGCCLWPALALNECCRPRGERRWKAVILAALGVAGNLAGVFALQSWWAGGIREAWQAFIAAAGSASAGGAMPGAADWLRAEGEQLLGSFGPVVLLGAVVGLLVLPLCRSRAGVARVLPALLLVPLLNVALFPARAWFHGFWWFYLVPFAALAAALPVGQLRIPRAVVLLLALVFVGDQVRVLAAWRASSRTEVHRLCGERINATLRPRDVFLYTQVEGPEIFYIQSHASGGLRNPEDARQAVDLWRSGRLPGRRVGFLIEDASPLASDPLVTELATLGTTLRLPGARAFILPAR